MSQGRTEKVSIYYQVTETVVCNRCLYKVPEMVGTNAYTNENHKFYNSMVPFIPRGGGDSTTKVGTLCACFVDMVSPEKSCIKCSE